MCLERLQQLTATETTGRTGVRIGELAYINGLHAEKAKDEVLALDMFGIAVSNAYM